MDLIPDIDARKLRRLPPEAFRSLAAQSLDLLQTDRRENQILYYRPASAAAERIHYSRAPIVGCGGGNRSSKTETVFVEIAALSTGVFPQHQEINEEFHAKFRGPLNVRVVCRSLTTVLDQILLPKLQWWKWVGADDPGGMRGHWGWIPKLCLRDASWQRSWSAQLSTLTVLCRDPDEFDHVLGESTIQFMSHGQDPADFASGSFHIIMHDEVPSQAIWSENRARSLDVKGRRFLVMTWPEDPSIEVDWVFDEVYEPGRPGPNKSDRVDWFELYTTDNQFVDPKFVEEEAANWSEQVRGVRLFGQPIRFSNLVHPLFSDLPRVWCFRCGVPRVVVDEICRECGSSDTAEYCHVGDFEVEPAWPCVFLLDPHPRKPHMFCWAVVDPSDDISIVAEGAVDGEPVDVRQAVDDIERRLSLNTTIRLIDPNMGRSPANARIRENTWQDEFWEAGLVCDLADDSDVGRGRVNEYLKPDERTARPRLRVHSRCPTVISQIKRYAWDEYRHSAERDLKQKPRDKYDDYPTLWKYLLNFAPTFRMLSRGAPVITRPGTRKGAY